MYELLSRRENGLPPIQFEKVSEKCRNQFITLFNQALDYSGLSPGNVYDIIRMNLGLKPISPGYIMMYGEMDEITEDLDDTQFKDLIDLVCQIFYDETEEIVY